MACKRSARCIQRGATVTLVTLRWMEHRAPGVARAGGTKSLGPGIVKAALQNTFPIR
jgi:hypothetical protein